jgi:hypothetical protein
MVSGFLNIPTFDYHNLDINNRILILSLLKDRPLLCYFRVSPQLDGFPAASGRTCRKPGAPG